MPGILLASGSKKMAGGGNSLLTSLVSYWKLDEASGNAIDAHGSNDLTDNNTVGSAAGIISNARDFERDNQEWLSCADNTDLSTGDIDFTFTCWVKFESKPSIGQIISKGGATNGEYFVYYDGTPDRLRFGVYGTSGYGNQTILSGNNLGSPSTATWYFIVAWHDSTANTINIQINNGTVDSASHTTGVYDGTDEFALSINSTFSSQMWDGLIDEVGFWKRVLTSDERTDLYNSGSGRAYSYFA